MAKFGYLNSKTPEPIVTKVGMGDYVDDMTQHANIQTNRPSEVSCQMGEISLSHIFGSTPLSRPNKAGLKCPSARPSVHKKFLRFH